MAIRKIKDAKDLNTNELIYFAGHAKATLMSDGQTVEDAIEDISNNYATTDWVEAKKYVNEAYVKAAVADAKLEGSDITIPVKDVQVNNLTVVDDNGVAKIDLSNKVNINDLSAVAISGNYNDLNNIPKSIYSWIWNGSQSGNLTTEEYNQILTADVILIRIADFDNSYVMPTVKTFHEDNNLLTLIFNDPTGVSTNFAISPDGFWFVSQESLPFALKTELDAKQDTLVSGANIKTVFEQDLTGSGDATSCRIKISEPGNYKVPLIGNPKLFHCGTYYDLPLSQSITTTSGPSVSAYLMSNGMLSISGSPDAENTEYVANYIIDSKYLPTNAIPDWNESNPASPSFINNKTHYWENASDPVVLIADFDTLGQELYSVDRYFQLFGIVYDAEQILNEEFNCRTFGGELIVKVIKIDDRYSLIHVNGTSSSGPEVQLYPSGTIKVIDDAYIPKTIARKSDIATPDWNASEGDSGYIKNKPFGAQLIYTEDLSVHASSDDIVNDTHYIMQSYNLNTKAYICVDEEEYVLKEGLRVWIYEGSYIEFYDVILSEDFDIEFSTKFYLDSMDGYEFGNDFSFKVKIYEYTKISSDFVSNVITTLPQTLSDTDKNQVKANLGISTPDWNAQEGQTGYIKNKPFGYSYVEIVYSELINKNLSQQWYTIGEGWPEGVYTIGNEDIEKTILDVKYDVEYRMHIDGTLLFRITNQQIPQLCWLGGSSDDAHVQIGRNSIKTLEEYYIPDTIVRKSDMPIAEGSSTYVLDLSEVNLEGDEAEFSGEFTQEEFDKMLVADHIFARIGSWILTPNVITNKDSTGIVFTCSFELLMFHSLIQLAVQITPTTYHVEIVSQNFIVESELKTINGESIVGSGDIIIANIGGESKKIYNFEFDGSSAPEGPFSQEEFDKAAEADIIMWGYPGLRATSSSIMMINNHIIVTFPIGLSGSNLSAMTLTLNSEKWVLAEDSVDFVSPSNLKTINGQSLLGSGDIVISGSGSAGEDCATKQWVQGQGYASIEMLNNLEINDIVNNPITEDGSNEFNIADEVGNIGLKVNDEGLYVKDVIAGNHILSHKVNNDDFNSTIASLNDLITALRADLNSVIIRLENIETNGGGGGTPPSYTFTITTNVDGATIKLNGVEQSSITVIAGSTVNWEVSKDEYYSQSGSEIITEDTVKDVILELIISVTSLTTEFNQGEYTIFNESELSDLKPMLKVTANYIDGTSEEINDYVLSGNLDNEVSSILVEYGGKSTTFDVNVTNVVIPDGYTRYEWVSCSKTAKTSKAPSYYIYLPADEDWNRLSMECYIGKRPEVTHASGSGLFGARLASSENSNPWYGLYVPTDGVRVDARNSNVLVPYPSDKSKIKVVLDNRQTSPMYASVNDGAVVEKAWTTSDVINVPMSLLNNIPDGSTTNMNFNFYFRIGEMKFRDYEGRCVYYYIPVVNSSNKIGMFDVINQRFATATTAASVTIGNSNCVHAVGNW